MMMIHVALRTKHISLSNTQVLIYYFLESHNYYSKKRPKDVVWGDKIWGQDLQNNVPQKTNLTKKKERKGKGAPGKAAN